MNTHETYIKFRVSDELKAEMKKAANAKGIDLSGWLRMIAIAAIYEAENERGKGREAPEMRGHGSVRASLIASTARAQTR
jgi:hypothetical protein